VSRQTIKCLSVCLSFCPALHFILKEHSQVIDTGGEGIVTELNQFHIHSQVIDTGGEGIVTELNQFHIHSQVIDTGGEGIVTELNQFRTSHN